MPSGLVLDSAVVSHSEPVHTPCAPSASDAAIWRTGADAAGREHRRGRDRLHHLGHEHHRRDLTGVAARLVALRDHDVDAVVHVALRVLRLARQRGHSTPCVVRAVDDVLRRRAERVGDERDRVGERRRRRGRARRPRSSRPRRPPRRPRAAAGARSAPSARRRSPSAPGRSSSGSGRRSSSRSRAVDVERLLGHHDVGAVRLAVDVLVHPRQLDLELLWAHPDRAEHAEARRPC